MPVPDDISATLEPLTVAIVQARAGEIDSARASLTSIDSRRLQEWFDLHAQYAGRNRFRALGSLSRPVTKRVDSQVISMALTREVAVRDHYACRYCGQPLMPRNVFVKLRNQVGQEVFPLGRGNYGRHGARLIFGLTIDHVQPHSQGGQTDLGNLVSSCWPCNFGKGDYSVDEIGLDDPRGREPVETDWTGMTS